VQNVERRLAELGQAIDRDQRLTLKLPHHRPVSRDSLHPQETRRAKPRRTSRRDPARRRLLTRGDGRGHRVIQTGAAAHRPILATLPSRWPPRRRVLRLVALAIGRVGVQPRYARNRQ